VALNKNFDSELKAAIEKLKQERVYKRLNYLASPQGARVQMEGRGDVVILSSNNYLGLCNDPAVVAAGIDGLKKFGAGTGSVRFICGTFAIHRDLERAIAGLVGTEASLSYVSAWNANEGLTATIVEQNDFVVSDALNHASIIDSIRLAKAITKCTTAVYQAFRSRRPEVEAREREGRAPPHHLDGRRVLYGGEHGQLPEILQLAEDYDAIVAVDDSHGTGVLGANGRGTPEHFGVLGEVDIITSTLGKALGGAAGGFVAGPASLCDILTQRSRPQLFSNALPPTVAASALGAIRQLEHHPELVKKLHDNTRYFRGAISEAGFKPLPGETPIVPIIVGETATAIKMSDMLLDEGVFVTGFGFPVVPQGQARVRCQLSAAHSRDDLDQAISAFKTVGTKLGII
jgi:7-keto-8-aminopelargonate synthetase and related enzymes